MGAEPGGNSDARIIILGCVSQKRDAASPARDLYTSELFRRRRGYAEASGRPWFIYSALHGIVDPDAVVAPYEKSLIHEPPAERRRMGELAASQLEQRLGPLAGRTFEVHAGASYVEGLTPALARRRAQIVVPLAGFRIGEQLHWYGQRPGMRPKTARATGLAAEPTRMQPPQVELGVVAILATTRLPPFDYRWPADVEAFERGWDFTVRAGADTYRLRHGIGRRFAFGRERVRTVTWVGGQPMVEGAAADDYADSAALVSVLRIGGRSLVRTYLDIPSGYAGFRIVDFAAEIDAPYTRHALGVKLAEDDLVGWARHALLRARSKGLQPAKPEGPLKATPVTPPLPLAAVAADRQRVVDALLAYSASNPAGPDQSEPFFTFNPDANRLVIEDGFAFLLAVIFDQGIVAERAWAAPYLLRERLGHLDPARIAAEPELVEAAVQQPPKLQRYVNKVPMWVCRAAERVLRTYAGDARSIWADNPTAADLQRRFDAFEGIGQKKAAMAVAILARDLKVPIRELSGGDVAYDVHIRRVFLRTGLADRDDVEHMVQVARQLNPQHPGALDLPAWLIGRQWCRPGVPLCPECPIRDACPKLVERAAGVQGA